MSWFLMMVVTAYLLYSTLVVAADEIVVGVVDITSTTTSNYLSDQTMGVAQAVGSTPSLRSLMSADYTAKNITMTAEDEEMANVFLTEVQDNESISFMEASVPGNLSAGTSLFVVDPINITTASLPSGSSFMLYFFPTLPEEFYVFGYYFAANKIPGSSINVVLRQDETTSMIYNPIFNALRTALSVFRVQGAAYITSMASLSSLLKPSGTTILINTSAEDVPLIVDFLEAHDDAVVMISFDDLTKHFTDYRTSFGTAYVPAMERLLFTTNLPPWNQSTTGSGGPAMAMATTTTSNKKDISTYMNLFYKDVADTFHSPAGLRAYFTALIMNEVATTAANTTAPAMQQAIYRAHTVKIGNISFGPYSSVCAAPTPDVNACTVNRGTTNLMLWPYASMALGRGVGRGPLTGYVVAPYYTVDGSGNGFYGGGVAAGQGSSSSDNAILWAILAIIGVMLLLLLLLLLLCCCCGDLGVVCCACCRGHKGSELTVLHVAFVGERHRVEVDEGIASYRRDVHRVLEHHRCREVEETPFGFIVVPPTALKAVEMASDLQEQWQTRRREERYISYRIGMHSGPRDPIDPEYRQHHHHPRKEGVLAYAETVARVAARTANLGDGAEALLTENTQSHLSPMDCRHFGVMHKGRYGYHMDGTETEMEVYELTCCGSSTNASPLAAADDEHEGSRSVLPKEVSELQTYTSSSSASPHSRPVSSDAAGAMRSDEGERQVEMPLHRQDAIHESFPVREYTSEQHAQREQPQDSPRYMFVEPLHSVEERPHQPYITRDAAPATEYYCRHNNHEEDVEAIRERELPHDDTHVIHHHHEQVAPLHSVEERAHQKRSIEDPHATNKNNTVPPLHLHDTTLHQHEGMSYISPPFADTMIYTARGERCVEPPASVRAAPQHVYLSNNHSAEYYRSSSSPSPSPVYESASRERCIVRTAPPEEPLFYRHEEVKEHAEHREAVREEPAPVMEDVGEARAPSTLTIDSTPHNQYRSLRSSIVSPAAPRHDSSDERFFHPPPPSSEKRRDAREDRVVIEQSSPPRPTPAHGKDANEPHQPSPPTPTRTGIMHIVMENRQSQPRPSASPDLPSQWSSLPREESPTSPQHTAPATTTPPLPAAPTHYRRGGPSFHGSRIVSCFEVPNDGALYRITDTSTGKWAFYNDSTAYRMHVHFSLGKKSRVAPLGHTVMHENPETGLLEGHLYVEPGTTEMLCVGNVVGHKMRYYARPCGERRRSD